MREDDFFNFLRFFLLYIFRSFFLFRPRAFKKPRRRNANSHFCVLLLFYFGCRAVFFKKNEKKMKKNKTKKKKQTKSKQRPAFWRADSQAPKQDHEARRHGRGRVDPDAQTRD